MLFRLAGPDPQRPSHRVELLVEATDEISARGKISALGIDNAAWTVTQETPKVKVLQGQEVSLGCGTLIVIALIVMFFGRGGNNNDLNALRSEIGEMKKAVDSQTVQIKALQDQLDRRR